MSTQLIDRIQDPWAQLDPVDPLRGLLSDVVAVLAAPQPAQKEPANLCPYTEDEDGKRDAWIEGWESAQTAALAAPQPAQEPSQDTLYLLRRLLSNQHTLTGPEFREELAKIVEAAYAAQQAQSAQSPVGTVISYHTDDHHTKWAFQPEAGAWEIPQDQQARDRGARSCFAVYTTPPQRQPLTDELCDRAYLHGLQAGYSFGQMGDEKGFQASCDAYRNQITEAAHGITKGSGT